MAKIRYSRWSGRPKNVKRKDYQRYNLLKFGMGLSGGAALLCSYSFLFGWLDYVPNTLAQTENYPISKALNYEGDRTETFKFQGRLMAESPVAMPDEPTLEVIAGQLQLTVSDRDDALEPFSFIDWEHQATQIFLEQDNARIPVKLDLDVFPRQQDIRFNRDLIYETGGSVRTSKAIAVEYDGERYDLPPEYVQLTDTPLVERTREYLAQGQKVVILGGLEKTDEGPAIVPPLGEKARAFEGDEEDIKAEVKATKPLFIVWSIGCGIACYFLGLQYAEARAEMIRQSNR